MGMNVHLDIVSAEDEIFSGLAELVVANGVGGELGILPGHAPLLTQLRPGTVKVTKLGGEIELFYVSGGVLEVQPNLVTILADKADRANNIDEAAAHEAVKAAQAAMQNRSSEFEYGAAAAELAEASARLKAIEELRKAANRAR